jgi:hypothetical protein
VSASAAERMRESRQRKRAGLRVIRVEIYHREVEALVRAGWLPEAERGNSDSISRALGLMLDSFGTAYPPKPR